MIDNEDAAKTEAAAKAEAEAEAEAKAKAEAEAKAKAEAEAKAKAEAAAKKKAPERVALIDRYIATYPDTEQIRAELIADSTMDGSKLAGAIRNFLDDKIGA